MDKVRLGLVGLGTMARMHFEAIARCPDTELAALCSRDPAKLAKTAREFGVARTYADYGGLVADPDVDAIIIVTPTALHASMAIGALDAGKHVLCEKPPAMSAQEAQSMADCAERAQKLLVYGLMFRFSRPHRLAREYVQDGQLGEIYYAKAGLIRRSGYPGGWFLDKSLSGGGALVDVGPHMLDIAMHVMGNNQIESVYARTFQKAENLCAIRDHGCYRAADAIAGDRGDVEDLALVVLNFKNGATLVLETSFASHIKKDETYLTLLGTKGGLSIAPELELFTAKDGVLLDVKPNISPAEFDHQLAIDEQMASFAQAVRTGESSAASAQDGVILMRVIDAAYRSAHSGQVVFVNK